MRENRPYGSEGGAARKGRPYPYRVLTQLVRKSDSLSQTQTS
jgi:hypothetical protein